MTQEKRTLDATSIKGTIKTDIMIRRNNCSRPVKAWNDLSLVFVNQTRPRHHKNQTSLTSPAIFQAKTQMHNIWYFTDNTVQES